MIFYIETEHFKTEQHSILTAWQLHQINVKCLCWNDIKSLMKDPVIFWKTQHNLKWINMFACYSLVCITMIAVLCVMSIYILFHSLNLFSWTNAYVTSNMFFITPGDNYGCSFWFTWQKYDTEILLQLVVSIIEGLVQNYCNFLYKMR